MNLIPNLNDLLLYFFTSIEYKLHLNDFSRDTSTKNSLKMMPASIAVD